MKSWRVLLGLLFVCLIFSSTTLNAATADSFRYPVGNTDGTGWLANRNGLQWLDTFNVGGKCGNVYHPGVDFNKDGTSTNQDKGQPVYAVANGTVVFSGYADSTWGDIILIEHVLPDGTKVWSQYAHVQNRMVNTGTKKDVAKGQQIAEVSNAYGRWAAHLHFEIRKVNLSASSYPCGQSKSYVEARYYNPESFIKARMSVKPTVTLKNPANGAVSVAPTNVAFSWSSQNATNHRLVISTTNNFSGFVDAGGSSYCSNSSTCWTTTRSSTSSTWNLASGKTYYWKVRASGSGGDVWSSAWNFTTASATAKPVAPTGLTPSASGTSITLRWNDVSTNESGFNVYRSTGSSWTSIITTGKDATSYTNSGLPSNTTYSYKVCSYNTAGESCSSSVSAKTGTAGTSPSSVSVNPSSGSWTSNQNIAVTSAGATTIYYTMANTYDGSTPSDPSSPSKSNYNGTMSGPSATFELRGESGKLKKSKLRFVGCNNYGCGAASGVYSYSIDYRPSKPAVPGDQSAKATSSSSITLRWSDLSNDESGFRIYRSTSGSWSSLGNVSVNSTSYVNSGLSANTTYRYYVCSYNSAGESCPSNYVSATTSSSGSSGSSWDGKSPSGTACEQDATTVASKSNSYGTVQLRWSNTCKTNWTRVVPNSSSYSTSGKIRRTSDGRNYTTSGTGTRFTNMVYAPTVQSCASGSIKGSSVSEVCR